MEIVRMASPLPGLSKIADNVESILPSIEQNRNLNLKCQYLSSLQDKIHPQLKKAATFLAQENIPGPLNRDIAAIHSEEARLNGLLARIERSLNETFPLAIPAEPEPEPAHPVLGAFGMPNSGNNCFLNAIMQFVYHIGTYRRTLLQMAETKIKAPEIAATSLQLLRDQVKGEQVANTDTQKIRAVIHNIYHMLDEPGRRTQEDASEVLPVLFRDLPVKDRSIYVGKITTKELDQGDNPPIADNEEKVSRKDDEVEWMIWLQSEREEDVLKDKPQIYSFENHLDYYFNNPAFEPTKDNYLERRAAIPAGLQPAKPELVEIDALSTSLLKAPEGIAERRGADGTAGRPPPLHKYQIRSEKIRFDRAPRDLTFMVKRFKFRAGHGVKIKTEVAMPMEFEMPGEFVQDPKNTKVPKNVRYVMDAIVDHQGQAGGGHYVAYLKMDDGQWSYRSDSHTVNRSEAEIAEVAKTAYIYHYRRVDEETAEEGEEGV